MATDLTLNQQKALREIVGYIRRERLAVGTRLPEWTLAKLTGTSRSPIRVALDHLVTTGVVRYDKNRGYSVLADAAQLASDVVDEVNAADDPLYLQVADAHLQRRLAESVTEADLTRMLGASRADVRRVLVRAQAEGWAEREAGYGWRLLPMIDSLEAYDDMYALRLAIEPAGLLSPKFKPNMQELAELRSQQQAILDGVHQSATERFESNARFHEAIAAWSGNRLALQALRRLDQLRRLAEYRQAREDLPRAALAREHLEILDAIEQGDSIAAASLMKRHLSGARMKKTNDAVFKADQQRAAPPPAPDRLARAL
ncbi:MAG: GntR family transcriptional regulator [Burkholderiales bacterium]|uniref:FCD domain-containing protein n=1 Tax=Ottowia pentelensis TaxID=511108 RepID=A0ABV6PPJ7_9BURK|nr:GntR family transcriptional regulator [Ottowia sp.]MBN9403811.1 GntR family transcriptional regulator [Burkholderiales bacterium]MBS0403213.1 GntR family transcriptional regulator [Pseudomonadota bacterium]MBS0415028.1 GntR family transcriptional regulator [Pseudomonadota bacterium]HMN55821.1 GntR family transcriptional regulator [Ottowia sp.]